MENKKKIDPWLIAIMLLIVAVPIAFKVYGLFKNTEDVKKQIGYTEISFGEYSELLKGDSFVMIIGTETCPHCVKFKETASKIVKNYNIDIYYLDYAKLSKEESAELKSKIFYESTPTTVVISNGEEYNRNITRIEGNLSYTKAVEKLKKANIIKE